MARKLLEATKKALVKTNPYLVNAISPSRLEFFEGYGVTDDVYIKMMLLHKYAEKQALGWGADFIGLKELKAPVAVTCYPAKPGELAASVNRTINEAEGRVGDGMLSYYDLKKKQHEAEHAEEVADLLLRDNAQIYETCIYVQLRAAEKQGIRPAEEYLKSVQTRNEAKSLLSNTEASFWAASPLFGADEVAAQTVAVPMPAITLAWLRPLDAAGIDDLEGVLIGTDNKGGVVRLDLQTHTEERPNSNVLIVAASGGGKSALAKHIVTVEHLLYDTRVIVLNDPEGEYAALAKSLGGDVTRVGRDCNISPFEPRCIGEAERGEDEEDDEELQEAAARALSEFVLATTIPFVKSFLAMAFAGITDELLDYLDIALEALYRDFGITNETTFAEYYAGPQGYPVMRDLYDKLTELSQLGGDYARFSDKFGRLSIAIHSAAVGYDRHMWNTRTHWASNSGMTVIDTSGTSTDERMKQAQYYNLLTWTWSQVRAQRFSGKHIRIVADELHTIMNKKYVSCAQQIKNILQRIRKYDGGLMCITPQIADLVDKEIESEGKAVLENCAFKFYGKSSGVEPGDNLYTIAKYAQLEDEERDKLAMAKRGKFVVEVGTQERCWVNVDAIQDWEFEMFGRGGGK